MGAGDGVMSAMPGYKDIKMTAVPADVAKQLKAA
jgi:hypothetical protein